MDLRNGYTTNRAPATPAIAPVANDSVRFGGLIMRSAQARQLAEQLLSACNTAENTPVAPVAAAAPAGLIVFTVRGHADTLTALEAIALAQQLLTAAERARAIGA